MKIAFKQIRIGSMFYCNGNLCIKRSSRTALIKQYNRIFYYGENEMVNI